MTTAIVVYDSWYGCTKGAADEVARGLSEDGRIPTLVTRVRSLNVRKILEHDIVVVGSPNHFGAPTAHVKQLLKELRAFDLRGKQFAFFDTCFPKDRGKVVHKMEAALREKNPRVSPPFLGLSVAVDGVQGPVSAGELSDCREFGRSIRGRVELTA